MLIGGSNDAHSYKHRPTDLISIEIDLHPDRRGSKWVAEFWSELGFSSAGRGTI